jgi:hypothetical protein
MGGFFSAYESLCESHEEAQHRIRIESLRQKLVRLNTDGSVQWMIDDIKKITLDDVLENEIVRNRLEIFETLVGNSKTK